MALDLIDLALGLLLAAPGGLPLAPDHAFHPRERAVGDWRWQAAADLDASPGTRADILLGRDPAAVTRCVRLNNYWCIKRGGWSGEVAADADGHVAFASAAEGATVAALLLRRYYVDYGRHSAMAIVSRWAPASCGGPAPRPARNRAPGPARGGGPAPRGLSKVAWASPRNLARFHEKAKQDCVGLPTHSCLGGTLRARWLASHGRRVAGFGRLRGRASSVPDRLIGAADPAPAIALGLGAAPASLAASLPDFSAAPSGPTSPAAPACLGDAVRIANYAAKAAAGIAASTEADLGLFDAAGRPTPHLARLMRNMASVEIGPLGAGQGLVDAAVVHASEIVAARRPPAP